LSVSKGALLFLDSIYICISDANSDAELTSLCASKEHIHMHLILPHCLLADARHGNYANSRQVKLSGHPILLLALALGQTIALCTVLKCPTPDKSGTSFGNHAVAPAA
jgi:hypothetical protein